MLNNIAIIISGQLITIDIAELEQHHYEILYSNNRHVCINVKRISKKYFSFDIYTYDFNKIVNKKSICLTAYDVNELQRNLHDYFTKYAVWATFSDITVKRFYYYTKKIVSITNATYTQSKKL